MIFIHDIIKMEEKIIAALKERGLKMSSITLYLSKVRMLAKKEYSDLSFLGEERVFDEIAGKNTANTRNSYLNACLSILMCFPEYEEITRRFKKLADEQQESINKTGDEMRGKKNERESKNWIEWEEVLKKREELKEQTASIREKSDRLTVWQYDALVRYVILSLYSLLPPRRNRDYHRMKIVNKESSMRLNPEEGNYYIVDKGVFRFGDYKTASSHGVQDVVVPEELKTVLEEYMKHRPKYVEYGESGKKKINWRNQGEMLLNYHGEIEESENFITRVLNKIFDRNISSSMLRHSYASKYYSGIDPKIAFEMARLMGHSPQMALGTYVKV